jgi:hypothetical protein
LSQFFERKSPAERPPTSPQYTVAASAAALVGLRILLFHDWRIRRTSFANASAPVIFVPFGRSALLCALAPRLSELFFKKIFDERWVRGQSKSGRGNPFSYAAFRTFRKTPHRL